MRDNHGVSCFAFHDFVCNLFGMTKPDVNITTRQLAALIPTDPSTVRRWVEKGWLTPAAVTPGGHYRFDPDDAIAEITRVGERRKFREGGAAA